MTSTVRCLSCRRSSCSALRTENFRQIHERVLDCLADEPPELEQIPLNFHLTSVYDHTLRDAFSRVLHKLIDSLPYLEGLLNVFCSVSVLFVTLVLLTRQMFHQEYFMS